MPLGWLSPSHFQMASNLAAVSTPSCGVLHGEAGFTLIELIMVIVIIGVLAVFVLPSLDLTSFRLRGFADDLKSQTAAMQRLALTQRRPVIATFTPTGASYAYVQGEVLATVDCPLSASPCLAESSSVTFNASNSGSAVTSTGRALPVTVQRDTVTMRFQIETETGLFHAVP